MPRDTDEHDPSGSSSERVQFTKRSVLKFLGSAGVAGAIGGGASVSAAAKGAPGEDQDGSRFENCCIELTGGDRDGMVFFDTDATVPTRSST